MKKLLLQLLALPAIAFAQTPTPPPPAPAPPAVAESAPPAPKPSLWKLDMQTGLNINQATYSDNWKAGGVSSVAVSTFLNAKAVRKTELSEWTNDLQLLYGTVANEGQSVRKNADRIFFDSKYAKNFRPNGTCLVRSTL